MALIFGRTERDYAQRIIDRSVDIVNYVNRYYNDDDLLNLASRIYNINRTRIKVHPDNLENLLTQLTNVLHYAGVPHNYDDLLIARFPMTVAQAAGTKRRKKTKRSKKYKR